MLASVYVYVGGEIDVCLFRFMSFCRSFWTKCFCARLSVVKFVWVDVFEISVVM
jgi:hypothetical protein